MAVIVRPKAKDFFLDLSSPNTGTTGFSIPLDWCLPIQKATHCSIFSKPFEHPQKGGDQANMSDMDTEFKQRRTDANSDWVTTSVLYSFCHPFLGFSYFHVGLAPKKIWLRWFFVMFWLAPQTWLARNDHLRWRRCCICGHGHLSSDQNYQKPSKHFQ